MQNPKFKIQDSSRKLFSFVIKKIVIILLILITIYNIFSAVVTQGVKYSSHNYWQRFPSLQETYYNSIYKNKHGIFLPDEIIYSYIGGALIRGANPIFLNPEVPPFGTYLIGISIIIFNNEHIVTLLFAVASLLLLYGIGRQIFIHNITALLPPLLFSLEPIFKNQLLYTPLLDIMQLVFLLASFYLFNRALLSKKSQVLYFLGIGLFLGFFISTKFFGTGIAVIGAFFFPLLLHKDFKKLYFLFLTIFLSVVVLYATYFKVLLSGYPFHRFLGIQKWIYSYNTGHLSQRFTLWPLLFLNKWYLWFGTIKVTSDPQWLITWPIFTIISFASAISLFFYKQKRSIEVLVFWILAYLFLLSFVQISSRYFVILIPVLYLVGVYALEQTIDLYRNYSK